MNIKQKALAHYDIMIAWVEGKNPKEFNSLFIMYNELGESYQGDNCPYCKKYLTYHYCGKGGEKCPLNPKTLPYAGTCCNGLWDKMGHAKTWTGWLKWARKVRKYIEVHG